MKTNTLVSFLTILLVIVYFLVWQIKPFEYADPSDLVPGTALLYVEQGNVEEFLYDLENSKLGKALQSIDFLRIGKEIELNSEELALLGEINDVIKDNWHNEIVRELLGKNAALALLQPVRTSVYPHLLDFIKANTVLITQPRHKAEFLQILVDRYAAFDEKISISTHQYGMHHIKRISIDNEILSAVVIDGLYLVSFEEQQLRQCIDTFDGDLPSLPKNGVYSSLRNLYAHPDQFLFLSLKNSRELIASGLIAQEYPGKNVAEKEFAATSGFAGFSYGAWKTQSLIEDKIIVLHDDKTVNNFVDKQLKTPPAICDTLQFSPQDPLVFYWSNAIDIRSLYQYYNETVPQTDNKLTELSKTLKDQSGETLDQLLAFLGKEFSYIITKSQDGNFLSIPYGIMLFKIENREKLETVLEKLASSYDFPLRKEEHGSALLYSWTKSPQDGLEPLYGFLDNYLFLGNSRSLAKQVVDSRYNGLNLRNDPGFLKIDKGLSEANNYISYTNNVELINIFKSLLTLASTVIAIEDKAAARKISILTKDVVTPLLDGLSMFNRTTTRSYFTDHSVVIDSMTKVGD
jgi:hypothetical protein